VLVEHRVNYAADGALLRPNLDAVGLLVPVIAAIAVDHRLGEVAGVIPGGDALEGAGFVDDPVPGDLAVLTFFFEETVDPLHLRAAHRGDELAGEELVPNPAAGDRVRLLGDVEHGIGQGDGLLGPAATLFGTSLSLLVEDVGDDLGAPPELGLVDSLFETSVRMLSAHYRAPWLAARPGAEAG